MVTTYECDEYVGYYYCYYSGGHFVILRTGFQSFLNQWRTREIEQTEKPAYECDEYVQNTYNDDDNLIFDGFRPKLVCGFENLHAGWILWKYSTT